MHRSLAGDGRTKEHGRNVSTVIVAYRHPRKLGSNDENLLKEVTGRWAPIGATNQPRMGTTAYPDCASERTGRANRKLSKLSMGLDSSKEAEHKMSADQAGRGKKPGGTQESRPTRHCRKKDHILAVVAENTC